MVAPSISGSLEKDGYVVVGDLQSVLSPISQRLDSLLHMSFPDAPPLSDFVNASRFLNSTYRAEREAILSIYRVLDRTPELVRAGVHDLLLSALDCVGIQAPLLSSYPTWRLDLHANPPSRTFPWHQEKYHALFSDAGVSVWAPLHRVNADAPSETLWIKPGSHRYGVLQTGRDKFDIIDSRVTDLQEQPVNLEFGQAVVFSNLLMHRSGRITAENGMRLSLQFRYDDLCDPEYRSKGWPANFKLIDALGT